VTGSLRSWLRTRARKLSDSGDMASSAALDNAIRRALTAPRVTHILVDLSKVTFLDSTGINTLIQSQQRAGDQNINLQVVSLSKMALRVLDITGVLEPRGRRPIPAPGDRLLRSQADGSSERTVHLERHRLVLVGDEPLAIDLAQT
jgi:anti-sigma B factor antagonist